MQQLTKMQQLINILIVVLIYWSQGNESADLNLHLIISITK